MYKKVSSFLLALALCASILCSIFPSMTANATETNSTAYISVWEAYAAAVEEILDSELYPDSFGTLYDIDLDNSMELVVTHSKDILVEYPYSNYVGTFPCTVYSVFDFEEGMLKTVIDSEKITEYAGGSSGSARVVTYQGTPMVLIKRSFYNGNSSSSDYTLYNGKTFAIEKKLSSGNPPYIDGAESTAAEYKQILDQLIYQDTTSLTSLLDRFNSIAISEWQNYYSDIDKSSVISYVVQGGYLFFGQSNASGDDNGLVLFAVSESVREADIPAYIDGQAVAEISHVAFGGCANLTRISIPKSVTSIHSYSFHGCTNLTDVYFEGTEEEWNELFIDVGNQYLTNATIHCLSRDGSTPMYRLYNPNSGEHFYTGSAEEQEMLVSVGWNYEGIAWNAPTNSGDPVYRCFNPNSSDHHYTMSWEEVENLVAVGWLYEGVAWNSASAAGNIPQYRLYNPNAVCGIHHYTSSAEEQDYLVSLGWIFEGIGWYGMAQ